MFKVGSEQMLTCLINNTENTNEIMVYWFKNGVLLESNDRVKINGTTILFSSVQSNDAGKYACKIKYGQSFVRAAVNLKVHGKNEITIGIII